MVTAVAVLKGVIVVMSHSSRLSGLLARRCSGTAKPK